MSRELNYSEVTKGIEMRAGFFFIFVVAIVATSGVSAQEWAGTVKAVTGIATAERDGKVIPLNLGDKVFSGDKLASGKDSRIAITLRDDTLISTGPNSQLALKDFAFNPATQEGSLLVSVLRGVTAMVSGLVAKTNPRAMRVSTPTATAGIRGTEFIVEVENE
jgi:hypothetical protein